ncbi:ketopantoate reductase family protein [Cupriavidus agavae]|uniref:2-dehydropantoate 2-reductase n=1 Tax=Cupriavidus agavae TaxID=1001822 RepID=A0A4Q7S1B1_9BURK|nr:2-dehydropantoate 2-reductase [Cupriavidus agavae]RZT39278.1 ketopantoate reductase [Cupriavidus agavae]
MLIAVIGAGAVGCFFGGMLAKAGEEVVLVGRKRHVDVIQAEGLRFESRAFDMRVDIGATTDPAAVADADIVLVCVKSVDTEDAARQMLPYLRPDALVVSLQNGIDNAARLEAALERPVIAAAVYVASEMAGPGHLRHHGRGDLIIGMAPGSQIVAKVFSHAGVPTVASPDVGAALWGKLILNCAYNAMSAIVQLPYGQIRDVPSANAAMTAIVAECLAVARAEGVTIASDAASQVDHIRGTIPLGQQSSMAQDFAQGRPSEIASLNGEIVRRGAALGIDTPANQVVVALVELLEKGRGVSGG